MDIIKAFQNNDSNMNITIKGTHYEPLFRASDIGTVLEISNIRTTIQHFDKTEKCGVHIMDIMGRKMIKTILKK